MKPQTFRLYGIYKIEPLGSLKLDYNSVSAVFQLVSLKATFKINVAYLIFEVSGLI